MKHPKLKAIKLSTSVHGLGTCYTSEMGRAMKDLKTGKLDYKMNSVPEDYCLRGTKPHVFDQGRQCVCCTTNGKEENDVSTVSELKKMVCGKPSTFLSKEVKSDLSNYKTLCTNFCTDARLSRELQLTCSSLCPIPQKINT